MPKVEIIPSLVKQLIKQFSKTEANKIIDLMESLEEEPHKGKILGSVGGIIIKELKYKNFRFYFIYDGYTYRNMDEDNLVELLFRFVRMSDKKSQQDTIDKIKTILLKIGPSGL